MRGWSKQRILDSRLLPAGMWELWWWWRGGGGVGPWNRFGPWLVVCLSPEGSSLSHSIISRTFLYPIYTILLKRGMIFEYRILKIYYWSLRFHQRKCSKTLFFVETEISAPTKLARLAFNSRPQFSDRIFVSLHQSGTDSSIDLKEKETFTLSGPSGLRKLWDFPGVWNCSW